MYMFVSCLLTRNSTRLHIC